MWVLLCATGLPDDKKGGAVRPALGGMALVPPLVTLPVLVVLLSTRCGPLSASATRSVSLQVAAAILVDEAGLDDAQLALTMVHRCGAHGTGR